MRFIFCGKALLLACLLSLPTLARADDFATKNEAAMAQNPAGVRCELRFTDGKSRFHMGETIRVTLAFSNDGPRLYKLGLYFQESLGPIGLGTFEVDPSDGVANPLAGLPMHTGINIAGYVPEPVILGTRPTEITVDLNQYLRFDKPGLYRLWVTTARVSDKIPITGAWPAAMTGALSVTSNIAPLEILPADPNWSHAQVEEQRKIWREERLFHTSPRPKNDLRYIGTQEAALAIIQRLGATADANEAIYLWNHALVGFRDRSWLIEAMKGALQRPDYGISTGFISTLSSLQALEMKTAGAPVPQTALPTQYFGVFGAVGSPAQVEFNRGYTAARRALYKLASAALPLKAGRAKSKTQTTLLQEEKSGFGLIAPTPTFEQLKKIP